MSAGHKNNETALKQAARRSSYSVCGNYDKVFMSAIWKVRYHCHVSGQLMFAACTNCNFQLKMTKRRKIVQAAPTNDRAATPTLTITAIASFMPTILRSPIRNITFFRSCFTT